MAAELLRRNKKSALERSDWESTARGTPLGAGKRVLLPALG